MVHVWAEKGDEVDAPPLVERTQSSRARTPNLEAAAAKSLEVPPLVCLEDASDCREGLEEGLRVKTRVG
jgi:hypothetical protein